MATLTEAQARHKVITEARKHVGYNPGKTYSKFGDWYGWPNALWCAAFSSWCFYQALGTTAAKLVIGYESTAPYGRGYIWTVAFRQWLQANGTKVSLANAQPGDIMFFKYPTGDNRNTNPVNHVDLVEANHASKGYITTIGGNTPRPGTAGDPSNGRGCWRHNRSLSDRYITDVYRPRWAALVVEDPIEVIYELTAPIIDALGDCGYDATPEGVKAFQRDCPPLEVDGIPGPKTQARLEIEVTKVLDAVQANNKQIHYNKDRLEALRLDLEEVKKQVASGGGGSVDLSSVHAKLDDLIERQKSIHKWVGNYLKTRLENLRLQMNVLVPPKSRSNAPAGEPKVDA